MCKKIFVLLLCILVALTGCSNSPIDNSSSSQTSNIEVKKFIDSVGREIEVPTEITRVAVTGPLGQMILLSLAPDTLIGISGAWDEGTKEFLPAKYYGLPVLGQFYGTKGEINLEELIKASPQVVIDIGETSDKVSDDMNSLQMQTGIPFIHINSTLESTPTTYHMLGELLNCPDEAKILADYCQKTYDDANTLMNTIGSNKTRLIYCMGDQGLNIIAKGSYHSEILDIMSDNLAIVESPSSKGTGNEVDFEQLLLWDPDVVLFAPSSIYNTVDSNPTWNNLQAIKNKKYYEVPSIPYNWLGMPPSVQRYLGLIWTSHLLYPDYVEGSLESKVKEYFKLFYHCELTNEQYENLHTSVK